MEYGAGKLPRLSEAIAHHYKKLKTLRDKREEFLRAAAGSLYPHAEPSDGLKDALGLMRQAAEAQTLSLAANRPRVLAVASTHERSNFATHYKNAVNAYLKIMHAEEAFQECARNAFYSIGIMKVYMADSTAVELEADEWMDPGKPFMQSISPHHFCYDTDATDFRHCSFMADRYRVRFQDVVEDLRFPKEVRDRLKDRGPEQQHTNDEVEWGSGLGSSERDPSQFEESIWVCDAFLPKDEVIYTFITDDQFNIGPPEESLLGEQEYDISEMGPYRFLNLGPVPDKTTPSSPAQNLLLQHNLVNSLYRKLEDQAERQKIVTVGVDGDEDTLKKMRDAVDGDYFTVTSPDTIQQIRSDGPDQPVFGFMVNALEQFSKQAGNLEHKLGLSASADTAKQQGMIGESVSRMEAFYQGRFVTFARECIQEIGRLLFDDSTTQIEMTKKVPGTTFEVDAPWLGAVTEGAREGKFSDYDLDIEPQSLPYRSAQDRIQELDAQMQMIIPLAPLLMQQGKMPNLEYYLSKRAEYSDMPESEQLLMDIPQPEPEQQQGGPHERTLGGPGGGEYMHHSDGGAGGQQGPDPMQMMAAAPQGGQGNA